MRFDSFFLFKLPSSERNFVSTCLGLLGSPRSAKRVIVFDVVFKVGMLFLHKLKTIDIRFCYLHLMNISNVECLIVFSCSVILTF